MKRKLLSAALIVVSALGFHANAQGWTASEVAAGDYYLYNVGANAYLDTGADWGTHAVLKSSGFVVTIASAGEGVYTIKDSNGYFTDNGYVDTANPTNWTFEAVDGLENTYRLKSSKNEYAYAGSGLYYVNLSANPSVYKKDYWKLVTATNRDNTSVATAQSPIELTHKIKNPRFDDNNSGWEGSPTRGGNTTNTQDIFNPCVERYNTNFDVYQTLSDMPNGIYAVSVQGFYRNGGYADASKKYNEGTETLNAKLYANGAEQSLMSIFDDAGKATGGNLVSANDITGIPNNMNAASYFFSAGLYWNTVFVEVTDGTLKIGIKKSVEVGADWTIFDNFRLQYFGACTMDAAKKGLSAINYSERLDYAKYCAVSTSKMSSAVRNELKEAITKTTIDTSTASTEEIESATKELQAAIDKANASIMAYASADIDAYKAQMATVLDNTNVYTTEAYNKWYANVEENYNNGEYTDGEVVTLNANGAYNTGWHSANRIDDVLLSAWTIGGKQAKDYDTSLNINTWSVEGNTDGSDFFAPFFEYWVGDGDILAANTLVSTVTGLTPSTEYAFSIRARVRQTNNKEKITEGITMKVGEGGTVDISSGKKFRESSFYIGNFSAIGKTDASGTLTTTITVAENSNISWLSFYNAKYADYSELTEEFAALQKEAEALLANETYKNITGSERTAVTTAKDAAPNAFAEYAAAINALKDAMELFKGVVSSYDALVAAKEKVYDELPYASKEKYAAISEKQESVGYATSEADATAKIAEITQAYRTYVESNALGEGVYGVPKTDLIQNANGDNATGWSATTTAADKVEPSTITTNSGQSYTDAEGKGDYTYLDKNGVTNLTVYQTIGNLAAGKYILSVTARCQSNAKEFKLNASIGKEIKSVNIPIEGSTGGVFGNGWNDATVEFTNENAGDVTISVTADNGNANMWLSIARFRLVKIAEVVNVTKAGYATLASEGVLDLGHMKATEGEATAYIVKYAANGEYITLTEQTDAVEAETGIIIAASEGSVTVPFAANGKDLSGINYLVGVTEKTSVDAGNYVFSWDGSEATTAGFYKLTTQTDVNAGKAYLKADVVTKETKALYFVFGDDNATAIETVATDAEADGVLYNVAGQQVGKDYKGIVIKNGKKYLNK